MDNISEFVWGVIVSTAGTSALLAGAAFLFRTQISHWLSKDLEAQKAQHQRDLESYKVSLIAETEKYKALQSLKTAAAMKVVDRKQAALERMHDVLNGYASNSIAQLAFFDKSRHNEIMARLNIAQDDYRKAVKSLSIFLSHEEHGKLLALGKEIARINVQISVQTAALPKVEVDKEHVLLLPLILAADLVVKAHMNRILSMGD